VDLFAAAPPAPAAEPLRRWPTRWPIDPDSLTPREALDALYRLKSLHQGKPVMTYCVGIRLNAGLVFLSDSRTNAGMDQISTFRKMMIYEKPGDRFMVLLSAGNLSISQSVREILQVEKIDRGPDEALTIWNARACSTRCACWAARCAASTSRTAPR
jgi:hypothetical protein